MVAFEVMHRKELEMAMLAKCHRFNGGSLRVRSFQGSWFRGTSPVKTFPLEASLDSHNENQRMSFWGPEHW